jgi:hypothetical protein
MRQRFSLLLIMALGYYGILSAQSILQTPLEKSRYTRLSGYADMMNYLQELDRKNTLLSLKSIGQSVEGRDIPALFISADKLFGSQRDKKPVVLIFCQQHGDEPSGKEAALILARELMGQKKTILKDMDVILIPQMNPDGAEKNQRKNAHDMDLNRNHVILSEPETQALHHLFREWMPQVTLDVHEYSAVSESWIDHGFIKDADEQLGKLSNLNISEPILEYSGAVFIPEIRRKLESAGFTFHEYIVGNPFEDSRLRYSTTAINDGRQSLGIFNTFSFILEGKQYVNLLTEIESRTRGQVTAMTAFLRTVSVDSREIMGIVKTSRQAILNPDAEAGRRAYIQMDYYPDSSSNTIRFPVFNLEKWQKETKELKNFHSRVLVKKSVARPVAYVITSGNKSLLEILERHGIAMKPLQEATDLKVEVYRILHVTTMTEEDQDVPYIDVSISKEQKTFRKGDAVVNLNQPAGLMLPLILEPESTYSLCKEGSGRKYRLEEYLKENTEYPVYRLTDKVQLENLR